MRLHSLPIFLFLVLLVVGGSVGARAQGGKSSPPIEITPNIPHTNTVNSVAISPDGARVLSGSNDGTMKLWDVETGRLLRSFSGHTGVINSVAFSPDGVLVLSGSGDNFVKLWEAATGKLVRSFANSWTVTAIAFSPDGKRILGYSDAVKVWDVATGRLLRSFPKTAGSISAFSFSKDGTRAAFGVWVTFWHTKIVLLHLGSGKSTVISETHVEKVADTTKTRTERVNSLAFSPDGRLLLSTTERDSEPHEYGAKLWDVATGRLLRTFGGHSDSIKSVAFKPDGARILTASADKSIKLWDTVTGLLMHTFVDDDSVASVSFSHDGAQVLSGSSDNTASLWDVTSGRRLQRFKGLSSVVGSVEFSPDRKRLLSAGDDKITRFWDVETGRLLDVIKDGGELAKFSRDGSLVLTKNSDELKLSESTSGKLLRTFRGSAGSISSMAFSNDGIRIAAGSHKTVEVWDAGSGRLLHNLADHSITGGSVAFSPDRARLVSGAVDGQVGVWDAVTGRLTHAFAPFGDWNVTSVAFSNDGALALLGGYGNGTFVGRNANGLKLMETATWRPLRNFVGHLNTVSSVAFSPDGMRALSGSWDGTIKLWDVSTGALIRTLRGHSGWVNSVSFSPDGAEIVSGSADTTIKIWKTKSGELLASFISSGEGEWVAITPEGFFAASEKGSEILSAVQELRVYSIDQLYQSLYRPDLVREKLAGDPRGLVREAAARLDLNKVIASGNAPDVRVTLPARGAGAMTVRVTADADITDRGGGIGRVEWRVNGLTVGVETAPVSASGQPLRMVRSLALDIGDNIIEVVAYNRANLIASIPARVTVGAQTATSTRAPGSPKDAAPIPTPPVEAAASRLFVLAAGLDVYADKRFRLQYSVRDANAMAQALVDSGKGLYQSVEVRVLNDAEVVTDRLDAAFQDMSKKIQPTDAFVLYLAGHGKTVDGRYYFVPQNFKVDGEVSDAVIDAAVKAQGISQEQWQRWFASIGARKSLILFDTCESGTLTSETKMLERGAANDRLAQATGRSIITASSGSTEAFEGYRGHGLFTYNLLEALDKGDGDSNGTIEVTELAAYVYSQVAALSELIFKQRQEPQMKITSNYPLTRQARVLQDYAPAIAMGTTPNYQLTQTAQLQIRPYSGATVVRSLSPKTAVTILKSEGGWSLVASQGRPLGYVATRDLAPIR